MHLSKGRCPLLKVLKRKNTCLCPYPFYFWIAEGVDFMATSRELTFLPDQNQREIIIVITNDIISESSENFTAVISEVPMAGGNMSSIEPSATITIMDDDSKRNGKVKIPPPCVPYN